jgi:hypothetical protein
MLAINMVKFVAVIVPEEAKRLNAIGNMLANHTEGEAYVKAWSGWHKKLEAEIETVDDDWSQLQEEEGNIRRKLKFARYVSIIKGQKLKLDGDMDNMFQIKKSFKSAVKKSMMVAALSGAGAAAAATEKAAEKEEQDDAMRAAIKNRQHNSSDSDSDS